MIRFHQLAEFDQGKRSCRRRLAGHNERRRKPPPGPLPTHMGWPSSSFYEDSNQMRGFVVDFSRPSLPGTTTQGSWLTVGSSEPLPGQWPSVAAASHSGYSYMQNSTSGNAFSASGLADSECLGGVPGSSCALSLLSAEPWGSAAARVNDHAAVIPTINSFSEPAIAQPAITSNYMTHSWAFASDHGGSSSSHRDQLDVGLTQTNQPDSGRFSGELELALQGNRRQTSHDPRTYDDADHDVIHWSL